MLGPEQVNLAVRPTPIFLEGVVAIQITEEVAKDLGLKDGQIVRGIFGYRGTVLRLSINNRELGGFVGSQFKAGDKLDLRVTNNGRALQPLAPMAQPQPLATPGERLMSLLFRPEQSSMVSRLLMPIGGQAPVLPQIAEGENARWLSQLMQSMARLSPAAVKRALSLSGLFSEGRLAGQLAANYDMKQLLKSLLRAQPLQSAIARDLESAIDEVESRQVESLQAQQNRSVSYSFLLPFLDANPVQVKFERGRRDDDASESDWVINLHTDSRTMGELWLKTTFKPSLRLDMEMWAERADIARAARAGSSDLHRQMEEFGLALGKMTVHHARRPLAGVQTIGPGGVVDIVT